MKREKLLALKWSELPVEPRAALMEKTDGVAMGIRTGVPCERCGLVGPRHVSRSNGGRFHSCLLCECIVNENHPRRLEKSMKRYLVREAFLVKNRAEFPTSFTGGDLGSTACESEMIRLRAVHDDERRDDSIEAKIREMRTHPNPSAYRDCKPDLFEEQGGICAGCLDRFRYRNLTVDHVIPWREDKGNGSDEPGNLQLLCGACNSLKGDGTIEDLHAALINDAREGFDANEEWLARLESRPEWTRAKKGKRRV